MADYYVDFSAANDGDGTTSAQAGSPGGAGAWNTLDSKTVAAGSTCWIRRQKQTRSTAWTQSSAGTFVGWPKSGDALYDSRPAGARAGWDGDSDDYAEVENTMTAVSSAAFTVSGAATWYRFRWNQSGTSGSTRDSLSVSAAAVLIGCDIIGKSNSATAYSVLNVSAAATITSCTITASDNATSTIRLGHSSGVVTITDCTFTIASTGVDYMIDTYLNYATVFNGCTFTSAYDVGTNWQTEGSSQTADNDIVYRDCVFTFNAGSKRFRSMSSARSVWENCEVTAPGIEISTQKCRIHLRKFTQTVAQSSNGAIYVGINGCCPLAIDNATFVNGNTGGLLAVAINYTYPGMDEIRLRNAIIGTNAIVPTGQYASPVVTIADKEGLLGSWMRASPAGVIESSSVARTGGESFSLKITPDTTNIRAKTEGVHLCNASDETMFVNLSAGVNTITLYVATKGFATAPTKAELFVDCDYLDQASGASRLVGSSKSTGALASDTSSWTGDSGLTASKLTISITAGQACVAPIRLTLRKQGEAGACVYVDPRPVVS